jgi:hypothetical protein
MFTFPGIRGAELLRNGDAVNEGRSKLVAGSLEVLEMVETVVQVEEFGVERVVGGLRLRLHGILGLGEVF